MSQKCQEQTSPRIGRLTLSRWFGELIEERNLFFDHAPSFQLCLRFFGASINTCVPRYASLPFCVPQDRRTACRRSYCHSTGLTRESVRSRTLPNEPKLLRSSPRKWGLKSERSISRRATGTSDHRRYPKRG